MSQLNTSFTGLGNPRVHVRRGHSSVTKLKLRALAHDLLHRLNHKLSDATAEQAVEETECRSCQTTKGCENQFNKAEYQRLVELGHWHYRRQRRRNRRL